MALPMVAVEDRGCQPRLWLSQKKSAEAEASADFELLESRLEPAAWFFNPGSGFA
jgi:hypothetical protein